jgi:pectinesterase
MDHTVTLTVSRDGNGDFKTIQSALDYAETHEDGKVCLFLRKGIYREKLTIRRLYLTLIGEEAAETVITYDDSALFILPDGEKRGTFRTPTVFIDTSDFTAKNLTFQNLAGPGTKAGQGLALYVDGDRITFDHCRILGGQDTLFTAPLPPAPIEKNGFRGPKEFSPRIHGRHYYKNCFICGDVDYIFGSATAYFEGCELFSNDLGREINGYVTAASTPQEEAYGYVFNHCRFTGRCQADSVYLGRPWRDYARVVIQNSELGEHIRKEGWSDWGKTYVQNTVFFAEYHNTGAGADIKHRVPWAKQLSEAEAEQYTREKVLGSWCNS